MERLRDLIGFLKDAADTAEERIEAVLEEHSGEKALASTDGGSSDLLEHDAHGLAESVAAVEAILVEAVAARASDIHFENELHRVRVRIRVDGDLRAVESLDVDKPRLERIVRVLKVRSSMDISEHRRAQGGQFSAVIGGQTWFVRAQTQPTVRGENVILRLLPEGASLLQSIADLGFSAHAEERYRRFLANPGGLILVVGPTGSGKTTTLYAGLKALSIDQTRKVISIEDPVEFGCEGIQQVEVNREARFTFADAMRAFVRQDPDVILLGEIRDSESALEAIRASQTGHLVLSTLHCNDAVDAVQRLLDLGMHANSVSSELLAVFAQRLAKRVCPECREACEPDPEVVREVFPDGVPDDFECFHGRGCDACEGAGTRGRIAIVEHLPMDARLRNVIARGATLEELRQAARESGIVSLRDRALELVRDGTIAFDSLPRFIPIDRLAPPVDATH